MCATHVFSLIMNILFCSSFKPSSGIYRYHKLVHVLHVYENWGLHVRGSFWRCFFLKLWWLHGSTSTYIYYHKLLRLFRKLVFLAFQWDLISPNKCVTYFHKKLIPSLVYTYNRRCTGRTFHRSSGTWYRDSSHHILAPDGHTAGSCVPSYYCCCLSLAESYGSAWTTTCQWKPVR